MFVADGRMSAEVIRVLASGHPASDSHYATTLFAPQQACAGSCTARSRLMLTQFTRWLRSLTADGITLHLMSTELRVA